MVTNRLQPHKKPHSISGVWLARAGMGYVGYGLEQCSTVRNALPLLLSRDRLTSSQCPA